MQRCFSRGLTLFLATLAPLAACGKKKDNTGTVSISVKSVTQASGLRLHPATGGLGLSSITPSNASMKSFTPASILMPIQYIMLTDDTESSRGAVYSCPGTSPADCLVDVTSQAALDKLTASAKVDAGSYTQVMIVPYCVNKAYTAQVKGTISGFADGSTYYTTTGTTPVTTDSTKLDYASLSIGTCGNLYPVPGGITVAKDQAITATLYLDATDIAFGGPGIDNAGGITSNNNLLIGLNNVVLLPFLGSGTGSAELYLVTDKA